MLLAAAIVFLALHGGYVYGQADSCNYNAVLNSYQNMLTMIGGYARLCHAVQLSGPWCAVIYSLNRRVKRVLSRHRTTTTAGKQHGFCHPCWYWLPRWRSGCCILSRNVRSSVATTGRFSVSVISHSVHAPHTRGSIQVDRVLGRWNLRHQNDGNPGSVPGYSPIC